MRLVTTDTLQVVEFAHDQIPDYAILSHRWGAEEVTLQEMQQGNAKTKQGYKKVQQCCAKAKADGYGYVWVDTCCIDKTSSAELSESINSMYTWYYQAARCYAFLADVPTRGTLQESEWFTRGWTLQELLAPEEVYFLDEQWAEVGTKDTLRQVVHERTGIPIDVLSGAVDLETKSVAQRMSWAASRQTTRPEDRAYSLLGIFGIQMPLLYGEGEHAFTRLQEEIMKTSNDHSLFAWASADSRGGVLATSPAAFADSGRVGRHVGPGASNAALSTSSRGIELEVRIIGHGSKGLCLAVLNCNRPQRDEQQHGCIDEPVGIWLRDKMLTMEIFQRVYTETMVAVDLNKFHAVQCPARKICIESGRIKPLRRPARSQNVGDQAALNRQMESLDIYDDDALRDRIGFGDSAALINAARNGDEDRVWLLLSRSDISINQTDATRTTAVSIAAKYGHVAVIRLLLARGADINLENNSGQTGLHLAAINGHTAVVELLTAEESLAIDLKDRSGCTPLFLAVLHEQQATIQVLLARGSSICVRDNSGRTTLLCAVFNGNDSIIKMLMENDDSGEAARMIEIADKDGRTPLRAAAKNGHMDILALLLQLGAQVNARDGNGMTILHWAARESNTKGKAAIAKMLLDEGAEVDALDNAKHTALLYAAGMGDLLLIQVLLDAGADVDARDKDGWTAVWNAAARLKEESVKLLVDAGSDINAAANSSGWTALHYALHQHSAEMARLLIRHGANVEAEPHSVLGLVQWAVKTEKFGILKGLIELKSTEFTQGGDCSAIGWAAEAGHKDLVERLLDEGADVNTVSPHNTILELAAGEGHESIVRLLLDRGANINQSTEEDDDWTGTTPLANATIWGHRRVVKLLLDRGADPDGMWIARGRKESRVEETPLHWAICKGHHEIIKMLLDHGASPNLEGNLKHATLWYAVRQEDPVTVKLLAEGGADLEFKDFDRETALHFAAGSEKHEIVRVLLAAGACVNTESSYGRTPLWDATYKRDVRMIGILLDAGADIEKGSDEETPLALAYDQDCPEVAEFLLKRGAKTDCLANIREAGNNKSKKLRQLFKVRA